MIRKYLLPIISVAMLGFAIYHVVLASQPGPKVTPPIEPARAPFAHTVAGAGLVEAQTENIAIGAALPGVVQEVLVKVGQKVGQGDPLFRVDDRQHRAQLKVMEANLKAAEAQLAKLDAMPRPEELPSAEARVREAQSNLVDVEDQYKRVQALYTQRAASEEELVRKQQAAKTAREQLVRAQADLDLLKAGAWEPDKAVARASIAQMRAQVDQMKTELDRLLVSAPVDGEVLQVNVRPGEFVGTPPNQALIVLGNVHQLHVRVDIDENDIPRFQPGRPAKATLRGDPKQEFPLNFVRVEPYVVPKKSLTGDNSERVDTRVLQVIYAVETGDRRLYVGQQMDVFVEAGK